MKKFYFYLFWGTACALTLISAWHQEFQFPAIMSGIFATFFKTND